MNTVAATAAKNFIAQDILSESLKQLGIAGLYALLVYVSELFFKNDTIVGHFGPASGLALATLLIGGKRYAWSVLLGAVPIHAISGDPLWEAVTVASGDTLQALCGAWLLTRGDKLDLRLQSLRDYLRLILLGGCASVAIGALAVNTTLLVSGVLAAGDYFHTLFSWWMSDTLGVILIAPLIMVWWPTRNDWRDTGQKIEAALLLGLTILIGQAVFLEWLHDSIGLVTKGYWLFMLITLVAVRLGSRGTAIGLIVVAIQALAGATQGTGFFADDIATTHLTNYWFYMVTLSVVGMALAMHFTERKQAEDRLRYSESLLRQTQSLARIGSWRLNLPLNELEWSDETYRIFGVPAGKPLDYESFLDRVHPDDRAMVDSAWQTALEGGAPYRIQHRIVVDGETRWVEECAQLDFDARHNLYSGTGSVQDITERKHVECKLRNLAAHLQTVREEEKTNIAREIHDDLGGTLTALKMEVYWLAGELTANGEATPLLEHIESMSQLIDNATNVTRRIITGLRPSILDDLGLLAALEWHAAQFQKRTGIECQVNCVADEGGENRVDRTKSINLFRIFQEALTNVSRHSGASRVEVEFHPSDEEIFLSISDNGVGMPEIHVVSPNSHGMLGMAERVDQLG